MKKHTGKQSISGLAALLLLGVFAMGILSVLLCGAGVYRRLTEGDRLAYDTRTCLQYVAGKVRQAPDPQGLSLSRFGEGTSLSIREEIRGEAYLTRIYCHEGWLMELFAVAEGDFAPEDGERIIPVQGLSFEREGSLLQVKLVDGSGVSRTMMLYLRGGEGAQP